MSSLTYRIVEHNGGFAYSVDGVYSETFSTHDAAVAAAREAAERQHGGVSPRAIEYQDADGRWHSEMARDNGPVTAVQDETDPRRTPRDAEGHPLDEDDLPNPDRAPVDGAGKTFRH